MKEIRTIKMVEQTEVKFIAEDGREFVGKEAEQECRIYEAERNKTRTKEAFDRLEPKQITFPLLTWECEEAEMWRVTLNSKKDYYAVIDYFMVIKHCCDNYIDAPTEYPYTMTVYKGWECISEYHGDLKEELQKALEQLG